MKISNAKIGSSQENYFDKCLTVKGWDVERIPDGCKQVPGKIIRVKSPFDYFATKSNLKSFYCDVKTTQADRFPFSAINEDQLKKLLKIEKNGFKAGYVIHFRQVDMNVFMSASVLASIGPRESLMYFKGVDLGKEIDVDRLFE